MKCCYTNFMMSLTWHSALFLLINCASVLAESTNDNTTIATNSPLDYGNIKHVPVVVSNPRVPNAATQVPKIATEMDSSEAPSSFLQTPTSVFFANYNSQQNVITLVRNIERRLNNIRTAEMRVAKIQEIFDSMQLNSHVSSPPFVNAFVRNNSSEAKARNSYNIEKDLRIFSKRLSRKLQKATNIVYELRDFLRYNISTLMLQHAANAYNDEDDFESDLDFEIDDTESISGGRLSSESTQEVHLYLNTYIQNIQNGIEMPDHQHEVPLHYNKQQIQILNYLKTDGEYADLHALPPALYYENNIRSLEANNLIADKIHRIKAGLMSTSDSGDIGTFSGNAANAKLRDFGNHFKHIFFLSRSDHASARINGYNSDQHFRQLYVSAIKQKFVFLLLDVGSAMNVELLELTKSFVQNVLQLLTDTDFISIITVSNETQIMFLDDVLQTHGLYYATRARKDEITNYISNLSITKAHTNHSLAFEQAFKHLENLRNASLLTTANPVEFVYTTRGLLTNLSDAMDVLNVIASGQQRQIEPIIINTCAVVLDEKRLMYEKQFLSDIATQNYTKYDIKVDDWYKSSEIMSSTNNRHQRKDYLSGKFFVLTKTEPSKLIHASTAIFESLFEERFLMQSLCVHKPTLDENSGEVLVSMTHAVSPFGIVGVNLYLADLIEDVVTYGQKISNKQENSYAFLIDRNGITIAHPAFPRPFAQTPAAFPVDIGFLENSTDFVSIRRKMLQNENGEISTTIYLIKNKRTELMERSYHWQSVLGIYVLCLVVTSKKEPMINSSITSAILNVANATNKSTQQGNANIPSILQKFNIKENMLPQPLPPAIIRSYEGTDYMYVSSLDLIYHRLDLLPTNSYGNTPTVQQKSPHVKICRYFRQVATMDAATLFLSSSAFESPFTFLHNSRTSNLYTQARIAESITAYIKDTTGLLANPGLRYQIRQEVNALYSAMQYLKKRHQDARGSLKNYILRRYIATMSGVLQVYPGCLLSDNYEASRRPWFRKAMQHPGKIVTTEPYLDAGGAGYIITIAHTIFEGKSNALHSVERDEPVAIVALDLPYAFFYKMILDTTALCQLPNIKCLLFENEGFLIAHPSMLEPSSLLKNTRRPHEHLTHKESYLANDILNHKTLVRKLGCANYQNRTLQRYYSFNTSLTDILTNVVHGERTKYAIALIRGSNIFAAVLNSTCDGGAFCPCSTIDRVCLNCNRMDQMDCECPCECPIEGDVFAVDENATDDDKKVGNEPPATFSNYTQQYPYCEPPNEHFIAYPNAMNDELLHPCVNINCDMYSTQGDCLAIIGCEWCQQDLDGNAFTVAFCTSQSACFNGVLSSPTPYGDLDDIDIIAAHGYNPGQKQNSYSAFGPVGGAIVVLGIVIGFAIYCYRHNLDAHTQDQFYIDSMQEENYGLPLSRFNFDDCQAHDDPPGNGGYDHPAAQRNLIHPADISPYHVSTGSSYRRPPNGESDNGYSTMTPHEDSSDHQCFTLAEPLLLHDKRHSKSDTMSISTSISSPTNRQQQQHQPPYPLPSTHQQQITKDGRHNHITSPKKLYNASSPARVYEQTTLPLHSVDQTEITQIGSSPHYILAPVTVHRHMETSES